VTMNATHLKLITGAYFSGKGYLIDLHPDADETGLKPDIIVVKPVKRLLHKRMERGAAPAGLLHLLDKKSWRSLDYIIAETGYRADFIQAVLGDAEKAGWVESKSDAAGRPEWMIKDYVAPVSECIYVCCGIEDPLAARDILGKTRGCYHRAYMVFPYYVNDALLHDCRRDELGVLVFDEKSGCFDEQLRAHRLKITDRKTFLAISEKIVTNHCVSLKMT